MADTKPDIQLMFNGQYFPRYRYETRIASSARLEKGLQSRSPSSSPTAYRTSTSSNSASAFRAGPTPPTGGIFDKLETELAPIDNITDAALKAFTAHYADQSITKDQIFDYVYGVLHAPAYRERFANDLSKDLPRVPFAPDFHTFARAGAQLAELHLNYETCEEYPLQLQFPRGGEPAREHYRLTARKMKLTGDGATLAINEHVHLTGIPPEAHDYEVNGRSPLGWFIDRYHIKTDKRSGITNDPNGWFDDPRDLIPAICRVVHVSVETVRIVEGLPSPFPSNERD